MGCPAWRTSLREYVRRLPDGDERRGDETHRPLLARAHAVLSKCRTTHEAGADRGLDWRMMPDGWCAATPYHEYGCYAGERHRCGETGAGRDRAARGRPIRCILRMTSLSERSCVLGTLMIDREWMRKQETTCTLLRLMLASDTGD